MSDDNTPRKRGRPKGSRESLRKKREKFSGKERLGAAIVAVKLLDAGRNRGWIIDHLMRAYGKKQRWAEIQISFAKEHLLPGYRKKKKRLSEVNECWSTGQSTPDFLRGAYLEFLGAEGEQAYQDEAADLFQVEEEWIGLPK